MKPLYNFRRASIFYKPSEHCFAAATYCVGSIVCSKISPKFIDFHATLLIPSFIARFNGNGESLGLTGKVFQN